MLTFFRTNQPLANIFLLVYLGVVRLSTFIHPLPFIPKSQGILTEWMYAELPPTSFGAQIASFLLVFIQAIFINITMARYRVSNEITLLPGLFYCLITALLPDFLALSPALLANTFLIIALFYLFEVYKNTQASIRIFDVGFWVGVAGLFHFSYTFFIFWGILGLGILRGIRFKELLMFLLGIFAPFFLFSSYLFWIDRFPYMYKHFANNLSFFSFIKYSNSAAYVKLGIVSLLIAIVVLANNQFSTKRGISVQKFLSCVYWMLFIGGITTLFQSNVDLSHLLIISVPLSILLSLLFQRTSIAIAEVLHMLLLVTSLILQFEYLLAGAN
jgi:hypothetical protein